MAIVGPKKPVAAVEGVWGRIRVMTSPTCFRRLLPRPQARRMKRRYMDRQHVERRVTVLALVFIFFSNRKKQSNSNGLDMSSLHFFYRVGLLICLRGLQRRTWLFASPTPLVFRGEAPALFV